MRDCNIFSVIFCFLEVFSNNYLIPYNLSWGTLASIVWESNSRPRKVMQVEGKAGLPSLMGTPVVLHTDRNVSMSLSNLSELRGSTKRK